jgi:hypothetical protein
MRALAIFPPAEHQLIVSSNDYAELILFTCVQLIVVAAIVTIWRRYRSES